MYGQLYTICKSLFNVIRCVLCVSYAVSYAYCFSVRVRRSADLGVADCARLHFDGSTKKYTAMVSKSASNIHLYFGGNVSSTRPSGTTKGTQLQI